MIAESQKENFRKIAFNIYSVRKAKGLTQQQLANISEVERSKISRIENYEEDFVFSTILKLAIGLEVGVETIINLNVIVPKSFEQDKTKIPRQKKVK